MNPAQVRFREKVNAYRRAFTEAMPLSRHWAVRLAVRLGAARLAGILLSDQQWLAIVLADLRLFCHVEKTTHVFSREDPHGRDTAQLEGRRQVYMRLEQLLALTTGELDLMMRLFKEDKRESERDG